MKQPFSLSRYWNTTEFFLTKSLEFWTLYFVFWASVALGLMFAISPFVEVQNRLSAPNAILLYLLAIFIFMISRFWIHKNYVSKNRCLNISMTKMMYFMISLGVSGIFISFLPGDNYKSLRKIVFYMSDNYSSEVVKYFFSSLVGVPVVVWILSILQKGKFTSKQDVLMIFPSVLVGLIIYSYFSRTFGIDKLVETKLMGNLLLGSIPVWLVRILIFGKSKG